MKKVALHNLGCKVNAYETEAMQELLEKHGYEIVPFQEGADVYIINTCTVTNMADRKSRQMLHKARKMNPDSIVVACGCYVQAKKDDIPEGIDIVVGNNKKQNIVEILENYEKEKNQDGQRETSDEQEKETETYQEILDINHEKVYEDLHLSTAAEHTRAYIKVQDGCNNFCAYCTVPYARGNSRNIPISEVLEQARRIAGAGIKEIVITGVNTGDFGRTTGESFLDLLKRLNDVEGIERYRISSIEPNLITEDIVDWIASGTKFQPHFHIPLQSGSDTILKRVGRRYTTEFFADRIDYIRSRMDPKAGQDDKPFVFFGIDVIAGLPGETEELFEETYSFLKGRVRPAFIHVFPYSRRPGTVAAGWKDQVKDAVKTERVARLEALCGGLHTAFVERNRGRRSQVLWESDERDGMMGGYTGNYIRVERTYDPALVNMIEEVTI